VDINFLWYELIKFKIKLQFLLCLFNFFYILFSFSLAVEFVKTFSSFSFSGHIKT
jgi:hypothetical protein